MKSLLCCVALACAGFISADAVRAETDRLDPSAEPVAQFVAYAERMGIPEDGITAAIFAGEFVPDLDDLMLVYLALSETDCAADFRTMISSPWVTIGQVQGYDCLKRVVSRAGEGHLEWNRRFGVPDEDQVYALARRVNYVLTRERDPLWMKMPWDRGRSTEGGLAAIALVRDFSAPYYFLWTDATEPRTNFAGQYQRLRSDYLKTLEQRVSQADLENLGLVGGNASIDALDDAGDGGILQAFHAGDQMRLQWTWYASVASRSVVASTDWAKRVQSAPDARAPAFLSNAAAWAIVRFSVLGDCGDPVRTMVETTTRYTDWYRGGIFQERIENGITRRDFPMLSDFVKVVIAANTTTRIDFPAYERLAKRLGCDSPVRKRLEANMVRYFGTVLK